MNDESPDLQSTGTPDGPSSEAAAGESPPPPKKRRSRTAAKAEAAAIEARIGHSFADPSLLTTALTHVSALKTARRRGDSYQRLEFLGDHVLGLIVSDMLYRTYPKANAGELSKRLADPVRKETCADVASSPGLP